MTELSRRAFFGGIGAAVVIATTAGSPMAALATPASISAGLPPVGFFDHLEFPLPRLGVSYITDTIANHVGLGATPNRLVLQISNATEDETETFENVRALYEHVFPDRTVVADATVREQTFHIARQSNAVAARTRRGAGNMILHSPNSRWLPAIMEINWQANDSAEPVNFEIERRPYKTTAQTWLADNEIIVLYDGGKTILDGPFRATVLEDGKVKALVHRAMPNTLGRASDFGAWLVLA